MALLAVASVLCVLALAACGAAEPRLPGVCVSTGAAGHRDALRAAPGDARLPGDVPISRCLQRVQTEGDLQRLGVVLVEAAHGLAVTARDGRDPHAALELGYLIGAARAGAARSGGISAQLAVRLERAGAELSAASGPLAAAVQEGLRAGRERG